MTTLVLSVKDTEVDKILETLQIYNVKVVEKIQEISTDTITQLFEKPLKIQDFQPIKREDIYE